MNKLILLGLMPMFFCSNLLSLELQTTITEKAREHAGKYKFRFFGKKQEQKIFVINITDKKISLDQQATKKENPHEELNITINGGIVILKTNGCINQLEVKALEGDLMSKFARSEVPTKAHQIHTIRGCKGHKWVVDVDDNSDLVVTLTHW